MENQEEKKVNKIRLFQGVVQMKYEKMKPISFSIVMVDQDNLTRLELMTECQHQVKDMLAASKTRPDLAQYAQDAVFITTSLLEIRHDILLTTKK